MNKDNQYIFKIGYLYFFDYTHISTKKHNHKHILKINMKG